MDHGTSGLRQRGKRTLRSFGRTVLVTTAAFGVVSAGVLVFAPEKLPSISRALSAFGLKGYKLPEGANLPASSDLDPRALKAFSKIFANIGRQTRPALVYIESKRVVEMRRNPFEDFFFGFPFGTPPRGNGNERGVQQGAGSGFIVDLSNGYVITNNHVVEGASELRVQTFDNRWFKAKVVGAHKETDVAVVKLESFSPQTLKQVALGDSDAVEVGDWVVALGAPFELPQTMTVGIVSAMGRNDIMKDASFIEDFIQTDAAINPGNSGGPLVNIEGRVVGMNTAIYSRTGSYSGIGFAVPANIIRTVAESLINEGKVVRGYLGINMTEDAESLGLPQNTSGVIVTKVFPGTPAEKAGLKTYDVIQTIDGQPVKSMADVRRRISFTRPGSSVELGVLRDGKGQKLQVKVGDYTEGSKRLEDAPAGQENPSGSVGSATREFGLAVQDLTPEIRQQLGVRAKSGVVITGVAEQSQAAGQLAPNDVILEVNRKPVKNGRELEKLLKEARTSGRSIVFRIEREGVDQLVVFRLR